MSPLHAPGPFGVRALLFALALTALETTAQAHPFGTSAYLIRLGKAPIGTSVMTWTTLDGARHGDSLTRLDALLLQHQRLALDAAGLPVRYTLRARAQGRETRIEVRRTAGEIIERVRQDGQTHSYHFPSPVPVDWLDNNAFDTLQALLYRHRGRLSNGTVLPVFVPQARAFGRFAVTHAALRNAPLAGTAPRAVLHLQVALTVDGDTVPLRLDVVPEDGTLLRYRQPALGVSVTRIASGLPVP